MSKSNIIIYLPLLFFLIIYFLVSQCFGKEYFTDENHENNKQIKINDNLFFSKMKKKKLSYLLNNNLLNKSNTKKNKVLFITFDNRKINDNKYILIHNNNINNYCKKWNYKYKFISKCNNNVYWCKIYLVLEKLLTNKYDYVVWLDSDTVIFNNDIDISTILNSYSSDIFVASDNMVSHDMINAGVFIIKNSEIGINFLYNCINNFNEKLCVNKNNKLNGIWAASCYEQGVMNLLIYDDYYKYTTVLPNNIVLNSNKCNTNVFIMHLYASSNDKRITCFNSKN
jgi:hypothetical protein